MPAGTDRAVISTRPATGSPEERRHGRRYRRAPDCLARSGLEVLRGSSCHTIARPLRSSARRDREVKRHVFQAAFAVEAMGLDPLQPRVELQVLASPTPGFREQPVQELQRRPLGDPLSGALVTRRQAWWCSKRGGILIHRWGRTHAWHGACCFTPTDSAKVDLAKAPRDARPLPRATRNAPPLGRHTFVLLRAPAPGVASSRS